MTINSSLGKSFASDGGLNVRAPLAWTTATIERHDEPEPLEVPAGSFDTIVYDVTVADGRTGRFHIESDYPHRIVRYDWGDESAELLGSERMAYWRLHGEGDESRLEGMGLSVD